VIIAIVVISIFVLLSLLVYNLARGRDRVLNYMLHHRYPLYGLDFVYARIAARGIIYIILSELEDAGLVKSWNEPRLNSDRHYPRRMYRLTELGVATAEALFKKKAA